jgi:hypothetical protein
VFLDILKGHTAGCPMNKDTDFKWTYLTIEELIVKLGEQDIYVSGEIIRQLLKEHKIGRRKIQKKGTIKTVANRNEQFENIKKIKAEYEAQGNPILSMDSKKKEEIGSLYRNGKVLTQQALESFDHDYPSLSSGKIVPHGLHDTVNNQALINIGVSKDTAEFVLDSLLVWWEKIGKKQYRDKDKLLILCDGGGSNNSMHYVFKEAMQNFANLTGLEVRIAHYPPYCSKYNPIEHRLFPHVTRALSGVLLDTVDTVKTLIEQRVKTKTGLKVVANVIDKVYVTGKKAAKEFLENMTTIFDKFLPKWNYSFRPKPL